ncbi:MAG TPA: EAL domain-containing protein [Acidimicrobiales bacterium]|nr:EAL domain-containing protein [Acidimicrobiales bacterium]
MAALAVAGVLTAMAGSEARSLIRIPGAVWAIGAAFAVAEMLPVHFEHRREAISFTLSTVPLVLGLFAVGPWQLVCARVAGSAVALAVHRRQRPLKLSVNVSSFALEVAAAVAVFRAVAPVKGTGLGTWPAAFLATATGALCLSLVIASAISLYQRRWETGLATSFTAVLFCAVVETSLGVVAVTLLATEPAALLPLTVITALVLASYRTHRSFREKHNDLEQLYDFASRMGDAVLDGRVVATVLHEATELMHAESASLFATVGDGWVRMTIGEDGHIVNLPAGDAGAELCRIAEAVGGPVIIGSDEASIRQHGEAAANAVRMLAAHQVLATPLVGASGPIGALVVSDRSGNVRGFAADDLPRFATLANHAGVSLENSQLVDRLRQQVVESEYQSLHDALTGLPNRQLFGRELKQAIDSGATAAVLLLDLDRFKEVNDTLGHHNGDLLLQQVGTRLRGALRRGDVVARLGGDEFAVLLPDIQGDTAAVQVAKGIIDLLEQPFAIGDMLVDVGASIGIAVAPRDGSDPVILIQRADVALYTAKGDQSGAELYRPERDAYSPERLSLVGELRRAVNEGQLDVYYQPQVSLLDDSVIGVEALVRWHHPTRGTISPDDFVSVAEHTGVIGPLTRFVLDRALAECSEWRRRGHNLRVSVNLSARSLIQASVPEDVAALLARHNVAASALCLEVTESSIMTDPRRTIATLEALRALGVTIAVDDFGTGHSSLAYIKRLPVGEIKVDRSFVATMCADRSDEAIVSTILSLARNLDIPVIAEGVEDEATASLLRAMSCAAAQGYLFGRPVSAPDLTAWLQERETRRSRVVVPLTGRASS